MIKTERDVVFEVGGRYRNRLGWYEVLDLDDKNLFVRYESDGREDSLSIEMQQRIIIRMMEDEQEFTPYSEDERNKRYFQTIGYLTNNGFIEAIIPPKSQIGFDNTFFRTKNRYPDREHEGYYVHHDADVDKWGTEMRLTFQIPNMISVDDLDFGKGINIVKSPNDYELRINNNAFCWKLLSLGFELGRNHDIKKIEANIPEAYRQNYRGGRSIT